MPGQIDLFTADDRSHTVGGRGAVLGGTVGGRLYWTDERKLQGTCSSHATRNVPDLGIAAVALL